MVVVKILPPTSAPAWLQILLKKDFYNEENKCKFHTVQYRTFFCKSCMGECFCKSCRKENTDHENHTTVKVCRVSGQASVNIVEFERFWNIKDIQPYIVNAKNVVLLKANKEGKKSRNVQGCRICHRQIIDDRTYKYCSIKCQIKSDKYINGGCVESNQIELNDHVPATASPAPWRSTTEDDQAVLILNESKQLAVNAVQAKKPPSRSRFRSQSRMLKRKRNNQSRPDLPVLINHEAVVVVPVKKRRRKQQTPHRAPLK